MSKEKPIRKHRRDLLGPAPCVFHYIFIGSSLSRKVNDYCKSSNKNLSFLRTFIFWTWTALRNTLERQPCNTILQAAFLKNEIRKAGNLSKFPARWDRWWAAGIQFWKFRSDCPYGVQLKFLSQVKKNAFIVLHEILYIGASFLNNCVPLCFQLILLRLYTAGIFCIQLPVCL